jgi:hypothetical protein
VRLVGFVEVLAIPAWRELVLGLMISTVDELSLSLISLTRIPFGQSLSNCQVSDHMSPGPSNSSATRHRYWKLRGFADFDMGFPTIILNPSGKG